MMRLFFVGALLLFACETLSPRQEFSLLRVGMEKGDVTDIVGSPNRQERKYSKDWWYYTLNQGGKRYERMVVFQDGALVYAGRVTVPKYVKDADKIDADHDIGDQGLRSGTVSLIDDEKPTTLPLDNDSAPQAVEPAPAPAPAAAPAPAPVAEPAPAPQPVPQPVTEPSPAPALQPEFSH